MDFILHYGELLLRPSLSVDPAGSVSTMMDGGWQDPAIGQTFFSQSTAREIWGIQLLSLFLGSH